MTTELLISGVFILIGTVFQVASGVGLGLIAGPVLLYMTDSHSALQVALVLNLILSLLLLPFDRHALSKPHFTSLSFWSLFGFPFGIALFLLLDQVWLRALAAGIILLAVLQLKVMPVGAKKDAPAIDTSKDIQSKRKLAAGGVFAGAMTSALAIPGPLALWTLLSEAMDPIAIRATLRAYYVVAYSLALVLHLVLSGMAPLSLSWTLKLLPVMVGGIALGFRLRLWGYLCCSRPF